MTRWYLFLFTLSFLGQAFVGGGIAPHSAHAQAVYVSPFGSDEGSGSFFDPVRTPAVGLNRVVSQGGGTMLLDAGFYPVSAPVVTVPGGVNVEVGYDFDGLPAVGAVVWSVDDTTLTWNAGSILTVDLGPESDALTFNIDAGELNLNGPVLNVRLAEDFQPGTYAILTTPSYAGPGFSTVTGLDPEEYEWELAFAEGQLWLMVSAGDPADLNGDGTVNRRDAALFAQNFGLVDATAAEGDFDDDGIVTLADLATLQSRLVASPSQVGGAIVPEPAGVVFCFSAALGILPWAIGKRPRLRSA